MTSPGCQEPLCGMPGASLRDTFRPVGIGMLGPANGVHVKMRACGSAAHFPETGTMYESATVHPESTTRQVVFPFCGECWRVCLGTVTASQDPISPASTATTCGSPTSRPPRNWSRRRTPREPTPTGRLFRHQFRQEMSAPDRSREFDLLAGLSRHTNLSLGCNCNDKSRFHRSVLARTSDGRLRGPGLKNTI
jgi:hypothetical protein